MKLFSAFVGLVLLTFSGCAQIDRIPDDQLAQDLNLAARSAVKYSIQAALRNVDAATAARIQADAKAADDILVKNVIPIFSGASTAEVLRSSVDTALGLLKNKITNPRVVAAIDLGVEVIAMDVKLPSNPAGKLDVRTTKLLNGIFSGISAGIESVFPAAPPAATAAPAPASAPPAARDPISLPK